MRPKWVTPTLCIYITSDQRRGFNLTLSTPRKEEQLFCCDIPTQRGYRYTSTWIRNRHCHTVCPLNREAMTVECFIQTCKFIFLTKLSCVVGFLKESQSEIFTNLNLNCRYTALHTFLIRIPHLHFLYSHAVPKCCMYPFCFSAMRGSGDGSRVIKWVYVRCTGTNKHTY